MSSNPFPPPASSSCYAEEFDNATVTPDSRQASEVARWRRAERARLIAERKALSLATHAHISFLLSEHLRALVTDLTDGVSGRVIAGYWPIRGELDLRPLLREWRMAGAQIVLPVVDSTAAPLIFRSWAPRARLQRGAWSIPVPPVTAPQLTPDIVLAPLLGWDVAGYRLGNGGGYYDRTLAVLPGRPLSIGVGLQAARLPTIYPQPHDVKMMHILTEQGPQPASDAS